MQEHKKSSQVIQTSSCEDFHSLEIKNNEIFLDGFKIKWVTGYELKKDSPSAAELFLKLIVNDSHILID